MKNQENKFLSSFVAVFFGTILIVSGRVLWNNLNHSPSTLIITIGLSLVLTGILNMTGLKTEYKGWIFLAAGIVIFLGGIVIGSIEDFSVASLIVIIGGAVLTVASAAVIALPSNRTE